MADTVKIDLRIPRSMFDRVEKLVKNPPDRLSMRFRVTRSEVLRDIVLAGLDTLEQEKEKDQKK